jgi:hypothetical protein
MGTIRDNLISDWLERIKMDTGSIEAMAAKCIPVGLGLPIREIDPRRSPDVTRSRKPSTFTISDETHAALHIIGRGNRSAAIEELVRQYVLNQTEKATA